MTTTTTTATTTTTTATTTTTTATTTTVREDTNAVADEKKEFKCLSCGLTAHYQYYGTQPPFCKAVRLLEDAYVMKDPFTDERDQMLILGAHCVVCKKCVCVSQSCSLFYTQRFCMDCVNKNIEKFPPEIQQELSKRNSSKPSTSHT